MRLCCPLVAFLFILIPRYVASFPQGGSAEACDSMLPRHVGTKPMHPYDAPFTFIASDFTFDYNDNRGIQVDLGGAPFKGFFVAAVDPQSNKRIGSWLKVKGTETLPCAVITHTNARPKIHVRLVWQPPSDQPHGNVIFVATVVQSFRVYYSGLVASIPVYPAYKK